MSKSADCSPNVICCPCADPGPGAHVSCLDVSCCPLCHKSRVIATNSD